MSQSKVRLHGSHCGDFFASSYREDDYVVLLSKNVQDQEWITFQLPEYQMRVLYAALTDVLADAPVPERLSLSDPESVSSMGSAANVFVPRSKHR